MLSTNFDYHQRCWWHRVFLRQRTIVDTDHCGGRTQIFGVKAFEPETSRPVDKRNFHIPTCIWRPRSGWRHRNFVEILRFIKLVSVILRRAVLIRYRLVTHGQTNGQKHDDIIYRVSIASRGWKLCTECTGCGLIMVNWWR